jgi:hypothetical protein
MTAFTHATKHLLTLPHASQLAHLGRRGNADMRESVADVRYRIRAGDDRI